MENIEGQVKLGKDLVMVALDKDLASSDVLGTANPISLQSLVDDEAPKNFTIDLYHEFKKTGQMKFTTQFIWKEPDPPPNLLLNPKCMLDLTIVSATFLKDADLLGKQDPYIKFLYNGKEVETDVKDDAGKAAEWNENFCLPQIEQQVLSGKGLVFRAYDKDLASSDLLGQSKPQSFLKLVENEEIQRHDLTLFDQDKKIGQLIVQTQFIVVPADPEPCPDLNRNCYLTVTIHEGKFFKDQDTFGK